MTDIINTEISLQDLPFPMFETTEEEKEELRDALFSQKTHLCNRIDMQSLKFKIREVLNGMSTLEGYFDRNGDFPYFFEDHGHEVRNIWIKKLLAYKGE